MLSLGLFQVAKSDRHTYGAKNMVYNLYKEMPNIISELIAVKNNM